MIEDRTVEISIGVKDIELKVSYVTVSGGTSDNENIRNVRQREYFILWPL